MSSAPVSIQRVTVIEPWKTSPFARLGELWRWRWLVPHYGKMYLRRRYAGTWLGAFWILRPVIDTGSRALLFGGFLGVSSGDRPYVIFLFIGTSGWLLFERTAFWAMRSANMIKGVASRVYLPRLPSVCAAVVPAGVDVLLNAGIGGIAILYYWLVKGHMYLTSPKLMVFGVLGMLMLMLYGIVFGLFTSSLVVHARDIRFTFSYVMQVFYFLTPVVYPISSLPPKYRIFAELNPITGPIELVKYGFLQTAPPTSREMLISVVCLLVLGWLALAFFSRLERKAVSRL
jgi:lipopolysaccharide transport system permease protein